MELLILAAGRGSRFAIEGVSIPKPLIKYLGKPLFWWAAQSALSSGVVSTINFCVLQEHIDKNEIDKSIYSFFPSAKVHSIKEVTKGAAETASILASMIISELPIAILDCDLAFDFAGNLEILSHLQQKKISSVLCTFKSNSPSYSYVKYGQNGQVVGAIEKKVVSEDAIAGLYIFSNAKIFLSYYLKYTADCNYNELYISGLIDLMARDGEKIETIEVIPHISFGTPKEISEVNQDLVSNLSWYKKLITA